MKRWWIYSIAVALVFSAYSCVFPEHYPQHHKPEQPYGPPHVKPHYKEVNPPYEQPHVKPHYEEVKPPMKVQPKPKPADIKPPLQVQPIQPKPKYEEIKPSNVKPQPKEVEPLQKPQNDDDNVKPLDKKPYDGGVKLPVMKPRQ